MAKRRKTRRVYRRPERINWVEQPLALAGGMVGLAVGLQALTLIKK
jgi:hypothetical protein|tara:strand:- start:139 stop:276 length:138 start_codon:yes stop_codon:yes gene_type:complete